MSIPALLPPRCGPVALVADGVDAPRDMEHPGDKPTEKTTQDKNTAKLNVRLSWSDEGSVGAQTGMQGDAPHCH